VPLPHELEQRPFTVYEAAAAGVSVGRLRYRGLTVPSRGVRVPAAREASNLAKIRPLTIVTPFSAASHASAFALWEFPGFLPGLEDGLVHISRPDTRAISRRRGVVGHLGQFFADEIVDLNGALITRGWSSKDGLSPTQRGSTLRICSTATRGRQESARRVLPLTWPGWDRTPRRKPGCGLRLRTPACPNLCWTYPRNWVPASYVYLT
jgi:hypothetical protein